LTERCIYLDASGWRHGAGGQKAFALGAFESGKLIGVASYVVCGRPATAEVAVVGAHNDHLRGVGTVLLRRLAHIAHAQRESGTWSQTS
jgi:hypothetical protein